MKYGCGYSEAWARVCPKRQVVVKIQEILVKATMERYGVDRLTALKMLVQMGRKDR